jgi:cell division ATPase FtsA
MSVLKKEQLTDGVAIPVGVTFNLKLDDIKNTLNLDKTESERIKRLIKNAIFESLKSDKIELKDLFNKINEKI